MLQFDHFIIFNNVLIGVNINPISFENFIGLQINKLCNYLFQIFQ